MKVNRTDLRVILYEGDGYNDLKDSLKVQLNDYPKASDAVLACMEEYAFFRKAKDEVRGLRFVGRFCVLTEEVQITVYCCPKYTKNTDVWSGKAVLEHMELVRQVMEQTGHLYDYVSEADFNAFQYHKESKRINRAKLAAWLVNDYAKNGAFSIREKHMTRENRGSIRWNRTILKTTPLIQDAEVAYTAPIRSHITRNDKLLLSDIHRCAVKEALDDLGEEGKNYVEPVYRAELLGKLEQFVPVIQRYQRTAFAQRDIELLRFLEAWCAEQSRYYDCPIGTVSFELVWEDILRAVFAHPRLSSKIGFGAPIYTILSRNYRLNGDSIPDGMNFWRDADGNIRFLLLDGKYFLGRIKGEQVMGLPGYKDIAKQIDYFETLQSVYLLEACNGINVFILPWWNMNAAMAEVKGDVLCGMKIRHLGYARKPGPEPSICSVLDSLGSKPKREESKLTEVVHLVQIDPDSLYRRFLTNEDAGAVAAAIWEYCRTGIKR